MNVSLHYFILISYILCTHTIYSSEENNPTPIKNKYITINNYNTAKNDTSQTTDVENSSAASSTPIAPTPYIAFSEKFLDYMKDISPKSYATSLYNWCWEYKYRLALATLAGTYGYLWYTLYTIQNNITDTHTWSAWKHDCTLESLLALPPETLSEELINTIQNRYINDENPTDFISPLIQFAQDIKKEQENLTAYETTLQRYQKLYLYKLITIPEDLITTIKTKKQRVIYLHTLFQSWITRYKMERSIK